jgi:hypothetical protein
MKKRISNIKNYIFLNEVTRRGRQRGSIKKYWEIEWLGWGVAWGVAWPGPIEEVRDICDPLRNKSGKFGTKWKFRSRVTAEQCYTFLSLKLS